MRELDAKEPLPLQSQHAEQLQVEQAPEVPERELREQAQVHHVLEEVRARTSHHTDALDVCHGTPDKFLFPRLQDCTPRRICLPS